MATKTKATPRKTSVKTAATTAKTATAAPKDTSAPTSETAAEVSATGVEQSTPQAALQSAVTGTTPSETTSDSPFGGATADTSGASEPVVRSLIVSSRIDGFRRSGRPWSRTAETVSIDDFTEDQVKALLAEPMLDVVVVAQ